MNCFICGSKIKLFDGTKLADGHLCGTCVRKLPSLLLKRGRCLQEYTLRNAMRKTADYLSRFSATASYGYLHIDEIHGLFCVSKDLSRVGKPVTGNNIFSVYDLTEVGLTCTSPRESSNGVFVDVELTCSLADPNFHFVVTVKRNCRCNIRQGRSKDDAVDMPSDLAMFQVLFNQMLTGAWEKVNDVLCGKMVHGFELEKARAVFMLPEGHTKDELFLAYSRMTKVYGDCVPTGEDTYEMNLLNKYFYLLLSHIEQTMDTGREGGGPAL